MANGKPANLRVALDRLAKSKGTGVLTIDSADGSLKIHIDSGRVVALDDELGKQWELGEYLTQSETIAPNVLLRHVRKAQKLGTPVEELIVRKRVIRPEILERFVQIQIRETLFDWLEESKVKLDWSEESPNPTPWLSPIPASFFVKHALERQNQWPTLRKRVHSEAMVFDKVDDFAEDMLSPGVGRIELTDTISVSGGERLVYYFANGRKTLRQLLYATGMGRFETYKSVARLLELGLIVEVEEPDGREEALKKKRIFGPALFRLLAYATCVAAIAAVVVTKPGGLKEPKRLIEQSSSTLTMHQSRLARARLEHALDVYYLTHRQYPLHLSRLVDGQLLSENEIRETTRRLDLRYTVDVKSPYLYRLIESQDSGDR